MAVSAAVEQQGNTFKASPSSRPFSGFERLVAWRYLRSRRKEASISVIAGFSLVGIMLGAALTLPWLQGVMGFAAVRLSAIVAALALTATGMAWLLLLRWRDPAG